MDLIKGIEEGDDVPNLSESSSSEDEESVQVQKKVKRPLLKGTKKPAFKADFTFSEQYDDLGAQMDFTSSLKMRKRAPHTALDDLIAAKRKKAAQDEDALSDSGPEEEAEESLSEDEFAPDKLKQKEKKGNRYKEGKGFSQPDNWGEKIQFKETINSFEEQLSFQDMHISRPLLKALTVMGFEKPTPIQAACIPKALMGKDMCACAVTGSGKTAAFMIPVLERLLFKPGGAPVTRVLVLVPTRELAVQVYEVSKQISQYSDVTIAIAAGGLDLRDQEAALRRHPDVVVATPGRLIDILHNSPGFSLNGVEVLVLDEADRMLDEYFAEQMKEVIRLCATNRQTMLFSATMTEQVADLARVSLKEPVKVFLNKTTDTALGLRQEFVKVRSGADSDREAVLAALVRRTFRSQVLVFTQTRDMCHRLHVVLGLLGVKVGELHGRLAQAQRLESLRKFKDGDLDVLLCTDVAARGLDIDGVKTVINFTMPNTLKHYVHRVGRTARIGRSGRSISLVGDQERRALKEVVKHALSAVKRRIVPPEIVRKYRARLLKLNPQVDDILRDEAEEKHLRAAENAANRMENRLKGEPGEPRRTWFQSVKERQKERDRLRLESRQAVKEQKKNEKHLTNKKRKQLKALEMLKADDRESNELRKAEAFARREAKRAAKPKRARAVVEQEPGVRSHAKKVKSFERDLTDTSRKAVRMARARPSRFEERKKAPKTGAQRKSFKSKARYKRKK